MTRTLRRWMWMACAMMLAIASTPSLCQQAAPAQQDPAQDPELQRGQDALKARHYEAAIKAFEKANKRLQNKCAECYLGLATAYLQEGDTGRAAESCDRALARAADDRQRAQAHSLKGDMLLLLATAEPKKLVLAENEFRTASQEDIANPDYHLKLGIALLRESRDTEGLQEVKAYLDLAPEGDFAEMARKLVINPDRARKNYAPSFRLPTLQGDTVSLDQLAGRVVVLDFWATWCHPCVESVPDLKDLTKKYAGQGLVLLSISGDDDKKAWQEFVAKKQMDWPQYWDSDGQVAGAFGVRAFPTYIVIDGNGVILQRIVGEDPQQSVAYRLKSVLSALPQLQAGKKTQ